MKIREIMTAEVVTIPSNESVAHAANRMKELNIGAIPVIDNKHLAGIITDRDIVVRTISEQLNPMNTSVGEVMTKDPYTCPEDTDIQDAVRLMEDKQIRRLVIENSRGEVTGIVSLGDLALALNREMAGEVLQAVSRPAEPVHV